MGTGAATLIHIDIMGGHAGNKVPAVGAGAGLCTNTDVLRQDKTGGGNCHVLAAGVIMRRNGKNFCPARVFVSAIVYFGQHDAYSDPFPRLHAAERQAEVQDPTLLLGLDVVDGTRFVVLESLIIIILLSGGRTGASSLLCLIPTKGDAAKIDLFHKITFS